MQRGISVYRFVEALHLALLVEEAVLVALGDEEVELEVAAGELHTAGDGCPLAEDDRFVIGGAVGEGVAADDVFLQHVAEREEVWTFFHHTALRLYGVNCTACV